MASTSNNDVGRWNMGGYAVRNNPLLVTALGLCPALAVSYRVDNAIAMGAAVFVVLLLSNITMSAISNYVPRSLRFLFALVVTSCLTSIVDLLLRAYAPALSTRLGIYVPLIAVNCLVLGRSVSVAAEDSMRRSIRDGVGKGFGFFVVLLIVALVREAIGHGTITLFPVGGFSGVVRIGRLADHPALVLGYSAGGLLVIGYLQGLAIWLFKSRGEKET